MRLGVLGLLGLGCFLVAMVGVVSGSPGADVMSLPTEQSVANTTQFQQIQQPLGNRIVVTIGGLGLIGLELWWFLFYKPKSQKAPTIVGDIQNITVMVEGGYTPDRIAVHVGQLVRLSFHRTDPNRCLEEVCLPDFQIARSLPLNQKTTIEFTPTRPGHYTFSCGRDQVHGVSEVEPAAS